MMDLVKIAIGVLPVFLFLGALVYLDSYKLVRPAKIVWAILYGCAVALVCYYLHRACLDSINISTPIYTRYVSPFIEEILKAFWVFQLIRRHRIGFMVDAAIAGFAVGTGFALVENIYYIFTLDNSQILLWIIRGFGTAVMHGGVQAIFAMLYQNMVERAHYGRILTFLIALFPAVALHSGYNHFLLSPVLSTIVLIVFMPVLFMMLFAISERATRQWLGIGLDTDIELLDIIQSGRISETRIGQYLQTLRASFSGPVVADMLCFIRLHVELSMRAKGILLARQHGLKIAADSDIIPKFEELEYLKRSMGKTGRVALMPILRTSGRDLWQVYMLKKS